MFVCDMHTCVQHCITDHRDLTLSVCQHKFPADTHILVDCVLNNLRVGFSGMLACLLTTDMRCRNLTRKDLLTHHLHRHACMFRNSRHADAFQCLPTTFTLPKEFDAFEEAFTQASKPAAGKPGAPVRARPEQKAGLNVWIMKPSSSSRGRGIYLLDDISAAVCTQPSIVQRYVTDPLLYQGYKFDIRLYVLVTSFNPLEAFVFKVSFRPDEFVETLLLQLVDACTVQARTPQAQNTTCLGTHVNVEFVSFAGRFAVGSPKSR